MTKERVNISIDSELLIKAKKHIPNLSGFIEECLKHYFGYADGIFPIGNVNEITDKIEVEIERLDAINDAVTNYTEYIGGQVLANEIRLVDTLANATDLDFEDYIVKVKVEKV